MEKLRWPYDTILGSPRSLAMTTELMDEDDTVHILTVACVT
jgi:hypothetical protein